MATAAKDEGPQNGGEYERPDAAKAIEIYDKQIKPKLTHIATLKGDLSDPWGDLKEYGHISKKDFNYVQSLVDEEDDAKRDHRVLCLAELLKARNLSVPEDLVSIAQGSVGADVVPIGSRKPAELATLAGYSDLQMGAESDGTETDLAAAGEDTSATGEGSGPPVQFDDVDDDFTEATEDELAQQEGRGEKSHFERMREATYGTAGEDEELPQAAE